MITESTTIQQQQLVLLQELLSYAHPDELREDATRLFYGYLASEHADEQRQRQRLSEYQFRILHFFTKLDNINKQNNGN